MARPGYRGVVIGLWASAVAAVPGVVGLAKMNSAKDYKSGIDGVVLLILAVVLTSAALLATAITAVVAFARRQQFEARERDRERDVEDVFR